MKECLIFMLFAVTTNVVAQKPKAEEVQKIITEIVVNMEPVDKKDFFSRVHFPLLVTSDSGDRSYSQKELKDAFNSVFLQEMIACLKDPSNYQLALPDRHDYYLAVCFAAPGDFAASVFTFVFEKDMWRLSSINLQMD